MKGNRQKKFILRWSIIHRLIRRAIELIELIEQLAARLKPKSTLPREAPR